ncbi:hypothetical protein FRC01_007867, partial [Tulasnella sp. 417]
RHINNLPEEILVMIFSFVLLEGPYTILRSQRRAVLLACKLWNRVVTDTPFFWAAISWTSAEPQQEWDLDLSRSRGLPFAIDARDDYLPFRKARTAKSLLKWAIVKSVRIWRFRFTHRTGADTWNLVRQVLAQTSLDLREIELFSATGNTLFQPKQDHSFLGADVPKLQSLVLHSIIVPWALCAIPTLRRLSISFHYNHIRPQDSNFLPTSADILSILASAPVLETLHLAGINQDQTQLSTGLSGASLPQLRELVAEGVSSGALRSLAESLDLPQTARVNFTIAEPPWLRTNADPENEFAQIVSRLAGCGLLQDCHLELEETALRATRFHHEVRLSRGGHDNIDYKRAFNGMSKQAALQVVSASISSMYSDDSREPLEAIHGTFPGIALLRFPVYRLGDGFGNWPGVLEDSRRATKGNLPESLFPELTAIEVDIDSMVDLDLSEVLSFIRSRNSPNRHGKDESHPHPILRLRITAPSKRIPAPQRSIWKQIEALVTECQFEATSWEDEEEETVSSEEGSEVEIEPYGSSDFE